MKNNKAGIIMIIIGIVLIVGFLGYRVYVGNFRSIASENLGTALNDVDYSIVHIGELSEEKEKLLKDTIDDTRIEVYISSFDNIEDLNKFLSSYELEAEMLDSYLIMTNGNVDAVINGNVEEWRFKELVRWYFFNEIPTSEISYKVPESAREYEQIINRNKYTVQYLDLRDVHIAIYICQMSMIWLQITVLIFIILIAIKILIYGKM